LIEDNTTATHLYRIAQEAVTNAIKHGKPDCIVVGLSRTQQRIILEVKDNGRGLPARPPKKPGMGLRIMRYRAGTIGGSLAIQKRKGGGTTVVCSMQGPGPGKDPGRAPERKA
jgi:signal transduction histidine kinase